MLKTTEPSVRVDALYPRPEETGFYGILDKVPLDTRSRRLTTLGIIPDLYTASFLIVFIEVAMAIRALSIGLQSF